MPILPLSYFITTVASRKYFFQRGDPPLDKENLNEFKVGTLMKKCFLEAKETHPDILRGGHRNPYQ
jgi:hypothetical protein